MRFLALALEQPLTRRVMFHPYTPAVLVDGSGAFQGRLACLRVTCIANDAAGISKRVHQVPNLGAHFVHPGYQP